jgi:hypothetical protein
MSVKPLLDAIKKMEVKYIIDTENGIIKHKNQNYTRKVGYKNKKGYIVFNLNRVLYLVHRIILTKHLNREIREGYHCDHINHNPSDNRICNLRELNNQENTQHSQLSKNNTSGFKGVSWNKRDKRYEAKIMLNSKTIHLGNFKTSEQAYEAYKKKAQELNEKDAKYYIPE